MSLCLWCLSVTAFSSYPPQRCGWVGEEIFSPLVRARSFSRLIVNHFTPCGQIRSQDSIHFTFSDSSFGYGSDCHVVSDQDERVAQESIASISPIIVVISRYSRCINRIIYRFPSASVLLPVIFAGHPSPNHFDKLRVYQFSSYVRECSVYGGQ